MTSVLDGIIKKARFYAEANETAGQQDSFLVQHCLQPALVEVMGMLNASADSPIIVDFPVTLAGGTNRYVLPPSLGEIHAVLRLDSEGNRTIQDDWKPGTATNPCGPGWRLEGNELVLEPTPETIPSNEAGWVVRGIPTGDVQLHKGTGTVNGTGATSILLDASPDYGLLDVRPNAYVGQTIRILESGRAVQERIITAHNVATRAVTVAPAFTDLPADTEDVDYEIAPLWGSALIEAVACNIAQQLGVPAGFSRTKLDNLDVRYKRSLKAALDAVANRNIRLGKGWNEQTLDSSDWE